MWSINGGLSTNAALAEWGDAEEVDAQSTIAALADWANQACDQYGLDESYARNIGFIESFRLRHVTWPMGPLWSELRDRGDQYIWNIYLLNPIILS